MFVWKSPYVCISPCSKCNKQTDCERCATPRFRGRNSPPIRAPCTMPAMPNIASVLKAEISRVARKEIRAEVESLRKATVQHRSAIASLKRKISELEKQVRRSSNASKGPQQPEGDDGSRQIRFSAQRLKNHRAKLGLSAKDYGRLVGVSGLTIYKWEGGNTRPRAGQLPAIAAVRKLGSREAHARLASE